MEEQDQKERKKRLVIFLITFILFCFAGLIFSENYLIYFLNPSDPYRGQQVLLEAWVLSEEDILSVQWRAEPDMAGFWKEEIKVTIPKIESMKFKGKYFWGYLVKKAALFPLKEGVLKVKGGRVEVEFQSGRKEILEGEEVSLKVNLSLL